MIDMRAREKGDTYAAQGYRPIDEVLDRVAVRLLRAMVHFDEPMPTSALADAISIDSEDESGRRNVNASLRFHARKGHVSVTTTMWKNQRRTAPRKRHREYRYAITDDGRRWLAEQLKPDTVIIEED